MIIIPRLSLVIVYKELLADATVPDVWLLWWWLTHAHILIKRVQDEG